MTSWTDFEAAVPDFAARVRALFERGRHMTLATLRANGAPRISGIECQFTDGEFCFGSMSGARKSADLERDPRFAIHSPCVDPVEGKEAEWPGEAKISGRARSVGPVGGNSESGGGEGDESGGGDEPDGTLFAVEIEEVVFTHLDPEATKLVIDWWTSDGGLRRVERT